MSSPSAATARRSCSNARPNDMLLENLLVFGRLLRHAGIDVHPGRLLDVIDALGHINLGARDEVYYTCRALLVHRHEQIPIFDRAFAAFWRAHRESDATRLSQRSGASHTFAPATEEVFPLWSDDAAGDDETAERRLNPW